MSCLLYNLAIEPLIEKIHNSQLQGFNINKNLNRGIVKVYADDTTVFIGPEDDPKDLQKCLEQFCEVSTACFNKTKTEVIPLGPVGAHKELIRTREYNSWKIEDEI